MLSKAEKLIADNHKVIVQETRFLVLNNGDNVSDNDYWGVYNTLGLAVIKGANRFDPEKAGWSTFRFNLLRGVKKNVFNARERRRNYFELPDEDVVGSFDLNQKSVENQVLAREMKRWFEEKLSPEDELLTDIEKKYVSEYYFGYKTYKEIGLSNEVSHQAVSQGIKNALGKLKDAYLEKFVK